MAAGGGGPGARSQRAAQITAQPAGRSGSRVCSRQPCTATAGLGAAEGSPSRRPLQHCQAPSLAVSSSLPQSRVLLGGGGGAMTSGLRAPHVDEGLGRRAGRPGDQQEDVLGSSPGSWTNFRAEASSSPGWTGRTHRGAVQRQWLEELLDVFRVCPALQPAAWSALDVSGPDEETEAR